MCESFPSEFFYNGSSMKIKFTTSTTTHSTVVVPCTMFGMRLLRRKLSFFKCHDNAIGTYETLASCVDFWQCSHIISFALLHCTMSI